MIGSSADYVRSGGIRNVPVTKAVEHLYATTAKFSGCVFLASCPAYSYPPRRVRTLTLLSLTIYRGYHDKATNMAQQLIAISKFRPGPTMWNQNTVIQSVAEHG
ncbi:hypothetical protein AVEN_84474-1 [Araneus ventricosus]|uniref:Uncharacterized protein n=1 Tax=Araneus ventricosus TaxID=182803 RepID=A0A4Y2KEX1_ARAVE|nr:hypothetical protein AVEN_84474-1 [Araneus ventricosus]